MIRLGRILTNEILEFIERDPDLPSGPLLTVALHTLVEFVPFLAPLLAPVTTEADSQGYGGLLASTGFMEDARRKGKIFFRRFSDVLNINRGFLEAQSSVDLNVAAVESPALFELDTADNPFDLDDASSVSPETKMVVKFLAKIALATGEFTDQEKRFIAKILSEAGESLTQSQFEQLTAEATRESLATILQPMLHQSDRAKEKTLLAGMLLSASDGRVEKIEKKVLAQALPVLGISQARYSEIAQDALTLIRSGRLAHTQTALSSIRGGKTAVSSPRLGNSPKLDEVQPVAEPVTRAPVAPAPPTPTPPTREWTSTEPPGLPRMAPTPLPEPRPVPAATREPASSGRTEPQHTTAIIWRCPACNMPQFKEYDVCPQCGVIVSKFQRRRQPEPVIPTEPEYLDVPDDGSEEKAAAVTPQATPAPMCAACGAILPSDAKFCTSCGHRVGS
jgi:tellurite resistance protein